MVFPRGNSSRSLAKFAALCALNTLVLQSSGVNADSCSITVSPGDAAVGILIVTDTTCASGGLGCINSVCRFCKTSDTPQSSHFTSCPAFTAAPATTAPAQTIAAPIPSPPTAAPTTSAPTTSLTCSVSDGDKAQGIQVISDSSCASGGLGCYNNSCRFCKLVDTFQSSHLNTCSSYGASFPVPSIATQSPSAACTVSDGDYAAGITAVTDATCSVGGLGCFSNHCRFCQFRTTAQSQHLNQCSSYSSTTAVPSTTAAPVATTATPVATTATPVATTATPVAITATPVATTATPAASTAAPVATISSGSGSTIFGNTLDDGSSGGVTFSTCAVSVSPGDAAVGIRIVTDATCLVGGIGCINDVCRFCKVETTAQSAHLSDCSSISSATSAPATATVTPATSPDNSAPGTSAPVVTSAPVTTCGRTVDPGDAAVGIQIATDASCAAGGLGCIDSVCRFCKVWSTAQSNHLTDCSSLGFTSATSTIAPVTTSPTTTSPVTTIPDISDPVTSAPVVTSAPATGSCAQTVNPGDAAVGIQIVADDSCVSGGVGCIDNVCRFCQVWSTTQSAHLTSCASIGYTSSTPAPVTTAPITTAPTTSAPVTSAPVVTSASATGSCGQTVNPGDAAVGIQIVADASCVSSGVGCIDNVCRFCQVWSTTQSAHLSTCASIGYTSFTGAPVTTAPVTTAPVTTAPDTTAPVTTAPVTTAPVATTSAATSLYCAAQVSSGDVAVGVSAVLDTSCASGGVGCFGSENCRYCQVENTAQSVNFLTCASLATPNIKVMKAAAFSNDENKKSFFDNGSILSVVGGIGAAAMVGMMAFVMKRMTGISSSVLSDVASDDEESEMATLGDNTSAQDEVA